MYDYQEPLWQTWLVVTLYILPVIIIIHFYNRTKPESHFIEYIMITMYLVNNKGNPNCTNGSDT